MASHASNYGSPSGLPLSAVLGAIPGYPRPVIERLVARLIERLDEQDGDFDLEDATNAEDEGITWAAGIRNNGPGCPVSDPAEAEPDAEPDNDGDCGEYCDDQRKVIHWGGTFTDL